MNDTPDAGEPTSIEQRIRCLDVHARDVVARAGLQHADAVHDCIDSVKQRLPTFSTYAGQKIRLDPPRVRKPSRCFRDRAPGTHKVMAVAMQP